MFVGWPQQVIAQAIYAFKLPLQHSLEAHRMCGAAQQRLINAIFSFLSFIGVKIGFFNVYRHKLRHIFQVFYHNDMKSGATFKVCTGKPFSTYLGA